MQLEFLRSLRLPSSVKQRLGALPPNLYKIYDENCSQKLESYQEEERRIVEGAFRFLLCAQGKLKTRGFLKALSVLDPENGPLSPDVLLDLCFNFIDIDYQLDVFRFAHLSVREYLEARNDYDQTSNHALAAECCLRLLCSYEVVERYKFIGLVRPKPITSDYPYFWSESYRLLTEFHGYACIHWAFHLASSGNFRMASPLKELSYAFMMDHQNVTSKAYCVWSKDTWHHRYRWAFSGKPVVELFSALGYAVKNPVADYLFAACVWGSDELMEKRIRAPRISGEVIYDSGKALSIATKFGRYTAVQLLLEHGASLEWVDHWGRTALPCSVSARSLQKCQVLVEIDAGHTANNDGKTPLGWAVMNSDLEMTRMLLRYGACVEAGNSLSRKGPLAIGIKNGGVEIAQILLEKGADPNARDLIDRAPLLFTVKKTDLEMKRSRYGLATAIKNGAVELAQVLLDHGADPNEHHNRYDSPVWMAAKFGDLKMLRMLFNCGARAPTEYKFSEDKKYPLFVSYFNADVAKLLQEHGCTFEEEFEPEEDN